MRTWAVYVNMDLETLFQSLALLESVFLFGAIILIGHGVVQAVWFLFSPNGLAAEFALALLNKEGNHRWITKPFYSCPPCMSSVWGCSVFFYTQWIGVHCFPIEYLPVYCLSLLGWVSLYEERNG